MLKHGQAVNVEVRPDCKMRDFSNTAQWNNSTPVSVDASVNPERQRFSVCDIAQPADADKFVIKVRWCLSECHPRIDSVNRRQKLRDHH